MPVRWALYVSGTPDRKDFRMIYETIAESEDAGIGEIYHGISPLINEPFISEKGPVRILL